MREQKKNNWIRAVRNKLVLGMAVLLGIVFGFGTPGAVYAERTFPEDYYDQHYGSDRYGMTIRVAKYDFETDTMYLELTSSDENAELIYSVGDYNTASNYQNAVEFSTEDGLLAVPQEGWIFVWNRNLPVEKYHVQNWESASVCLRLFQMEEGSEGYAEWLYPIEIENGTVLDTSNCNLRIENGIIKFDGFDDYRVCCFFQTPMVENSWHSTSPIVQGGEKERR